MGITTDEQRQAYRKEKRERDQAEGLARQKAATGQKYLSSAQLVSAILRAVRRGRIDQRTARHCVVEWPQWLADRPAWLKWQHYVTTQLLEVARCRRHGHLGEARRTLSMVHDALKKYPKESS
jgi:hypothetical protein